MSLETAAGTVAEQIQRQEFVEVFAHHDADGIAAASILCHAMLRAGIRFRLRVRQEITLSDLAGDAAYLLCDLGAGMEDLPQDVMVVDHHLPLSEGEFHVNPRLCGIDGDRELSAAGTAYFVAQELGDNRDLAGLVIPGIIGDGQQMAGKNLEIFNEGIANGIIVPDRGLTLPGRDMTERWYMAISPYLDGISGAEERIAALLDQSRDPAQGSTGPRLDPAPVTGGARSGTEDNRSKPACGLRRHVPPPARSDRGCPCPHCGDRCLRQGRLWRYRHNALPALVPLP